MVVNCIIYATATYILRVIGPAEDSDDSAGGRGGRRRSGAKAASAKGVKSGARKSSGAGPSGSVPPMTGRTREPLTHVQQQSALQVSRTVYLDVHSEIILRQMIACS